MSNCFCAVGEPLALMGSTFLSALMVGLWERHAISIGPAAVATMMMFQFRRRSLEPIRHASHRRTLSRSSFLAVLRILSVLPVCIDSLEHNCRLMFVLQFAERTNDSDFHMFLELRGRLGATT